MDYDDMVVLTPRRRRALAWVAGLAALLAVGAMALRFHGLARLDDFRRDELRHGSADPASYAPPLAPPEANATLALIAAGSRIEVQVEDQQKLIAARRLRPAAWTAETWSAADRHLAANTAQLAAIHRAVALPGGSLDLDYSQLDPAASNPPMDLLSVARLLELETLAAVSGGDLETATAGVEALGRLVALLHQEPEVMMQLFAVGAGSLQLSALREIVAAGPRGELVPRLDRSLAGTADRAALARAIRRETAALLGDRPGHRAREAGRNAGPFWHAAAWVAGELLLAEGLAGRAELARVDELPYIHLAAAVESAVSDLPLGPFEGLYVNLQATALKAGAAAASRQLAELALALAAAGERDGRYPAALPDHPAATTPDPLFASLPSYRVAADGSARLSLDAAEAKAGSEASLGSLPFVWELPAPRPAGV